MSDKEFEKYVEFLEESVVESAESIDIPSIYKGLQSPVRDWDGNSQLPTISKDEDLDEVVNKILRKNPEDEGTDDPNRDEGGLSGSVMEYGSLYEEDDSEEAEDLKDKLDDAEDDEEECSECEKKIEEIYRELGISPLSLLEEEEDVEDGDDEDDELKDEKVEKDEELEDEEDEGKSNFIAKESRVLETLIREMNLLEDDEEDEYSDNVDEELRDDDGDDEDEEEDEDEDGVELED